MACGKPTKARRTLGIRGQLMWFLCFICLFLLGLFWFLSTQLLEPLYTKTHRDPADQSGRAASWQQLDDAHCRGQNALHAGSLVSLHVNSDIF